MRDYVGFICDVRDSPNPNKIVGYSRMMRAIPLAEILAEQNIDLFIYSRLHINPITKLASGYMISDKKYYPVIAPVPKINGIWHFSNFKTNNISGMTRKKFFQWSKENAIDVYPNYEFERITLDKYSTYELIKQYPNALQPETELFTRELEQLKHFLSKSNKVFIKPKLGSQGNRILVISQQKNHTHYNYYYNGEQTRGDVDNVNQLLQKTSDLLDDHSYIIQQGIDCLEYKDHPFIIRVIMLDDGKDWHWTHKMVTAANKGDVANSTQQGLNYTLEESFSELFGNDADAMLTKLHEFCFPLTRFLDQQYPSTLMEIAFDIMIDQQHQFYLAEMDVAPGVTKPGMDFNHPFKDMFHISPDEQALYDKYLIPHATHLANFFKNKLKQMGTPLT